MKTFTKNILLIIIIILFIYLIYYLYNKYILLNNLKNETIISNIGEPYLMEDLISPLTVTLTSDKPNKPGGLSYVKKYSNQLNVQMVHDYYKHTFNINLPEDTHIIFGAGTTMMIGAYYYALQKKEGRTISVNTNSDIFYLLHKKLTYPAKNVEWINKNFNSDLSVIVSPSNPLGIITEPKDIKSPYMLFDVVYDKYLFTGQHTPVNVSLYEEFKINKNISITLSLSKLGLAGVRFGFLLTRDKEIAEYCKEYVNTLSVRYPTANATIVRLAYYKYYSNNILSEKIYKIIKYRKEFFVKYAKKHNINIINNTQFIPYIYTDKSTDWWIKKFNVETRKGSDFNDTDNNSRFNLMISEDYWNEFERRFSK
jgi:aspartate/methionine/tyrosine aminotransferase